MTTLNKLSNYYDFKNNEDFFNYIIESYINGQKKQFNELMTDFLNASNQDFQLCILNSCNTFGLETTIKILKSYKSELGSISDTCIINAFYNNSSSQLNEVKTILLNNY